MTVHRLQTASMVTACGIRDPATKSPDELFFVALQEAAKALDAENKPRTIQNLADKAQREYSVVLRYLGKFPVRKHTLKIVYYKGHGTFSKRKGG